MPNDPNLSQEPTEPPRLASASGASDFLAPITPAPSSPAPVVFTLAVSEADEVAGRYIHTELKRARRSLLVTQAVALASVLGTLAYLGYITITLQRTLEPKNAAEVANGLISERVQTQAQSLADQTKERVPQLIAQLPDYALKQMPVYRASLETQIDSDLNTNFAQAAKAMDGHFDGFLKDNKTEVAALLRDGNDRQATRALGLALQGEFQKFLKTTPMSQNNETAQQKLDQTLVALQQVDKQLARLAANKNLTPQEQKMRRAVAILSANIHKGVEKNGLKMAQNPF